MPKIVFKQDREYNGKKDREEAWVELDKSDTPDDLTVPYSELAMHTGWADKKIKPTKIVCVKRVSDGEVWASSVEKATIKDEKNGKDYDHASGLISELIPFHTDAELEKYKKDSNFHTTDQREHLDNICKKVLK
ncbi:MAG: hypothetical protein WC934_06290 [Acidithiobacillus sp.]|jgi:hypothetical protein|uniref:hypothetical protein n=1 Tax=Acidithiobacillus sp. TaxID=1872118 RepID=UPI00355EFFC9